MPRSPRSIEPGTVYHLISRFVDRNWYITSEQERACYLRLLGRALAESDWRCLADAVMSNHVHLAMVAGRQQLDAWIRRVHAPFATWMNKRHDRIGVMFVRGPRAIPTHRDDVGALIAYIHNNPVRAKLVASASESTWTSHRMYLGLDAEPPWLHVEEGLARAGFRDRTAFDRWVVAMPAVAGLETAPVHVRAPASPSRQAVAVVRAQPDDVLATTAAELGVTVEQLRSRRRGPAEVLGRKVVVHCAASLGMTGVRIAELLGMSQQGISAIGRRCVEGVMPLSMRVLDRLRRAG